MSETLEVLLTNDDGIDSPGIRSLYATLSEIANVTVVAPASDQSAVGRAISREVTVKETDIGYALDGTPSDCVVAGLAELGPDPDIVVSGCNRGGNLGEYALGRSGTISAAVEAAFFDVPAIATSLYVPEPEDRPFDTVEPPREAYADANRVTAFLVEEGLEGGLFEYATYLNVNAPTTGDTPARVEITRPSRRYEMDAERDGQTIVLHDRIWEDMRPEAITDPAGTDRRAVVEGRISVTPLTAPHSIHHPERLEILVDQYHDSIDSSTF